MAVHGDTLEQFQCGAVAVLVRYSCVRRDQYELHCPAPLSHALRDALAARGTIRGGTELYVVDVPATHQITVARVQGRVVIMPRMSTERPAQRAAALDVAALVAQYVGSR